jgi:hypothetical protein
MNFRSFFILFSLFSSAVTRADICRDSVALLGNESESQRESSREEVLSEIAGLYGLALNNQVPMKVAHELIQELAEREGRTFEEILREVELTELSPSEKRAKAEERRAIRTEEQSRLLEGLEPYLSRIGREHRGVIEATLIRPGLVNPLMTGEVEFKFKGKHWFVVGHHRPSQRDKGRTKSVSFGPGDDFAIGQVPVTQLLYFLAALGQEGVDATPSEFKRGAGAVVLRLGDKVYSLNPNHPVENMGFRSANAHAKRVSDLTGASYSLPTGLKWEFANRAGSKGKFHFGNDESQLPHYAWYSANSGWETHPVGELFPNAFHLYDTHGNVWEWTSTIVDNCSVIRGGSYIDPVRNQGSVDFLLRGGLYHAGNLGIRLVRQSPGIVPPAHTFTLGDPGMGSWNTIRSVYQGLLDRFWGWGK